jgi:hypothetical protein
VPAHAGRFHPLVGVAFAALVVGCGAGHGRTNAPEGGAGGASSGLEVHEAGGRPRLAVVRREGDPMAAIAIEVRLGDAVDAPGAKTAAIAAMIGARLRRAGIVGVQTIPGARFARVRALVPQLGASLAKTIDDALRTPIDAADPALVDVRHALETFAGRPADDPALARAARCLDRPTHPQGWVVPAADATAKTVEAWRAASIEASSIVVGVVGAGAGADAMAKAWGALPPLPAVTTSPTTTSTASTNATSVTPATSVIGVTTTADSVDGAVLVIEGASRATTASVLAQLEDPEGALALRLRASEDWRATTIAGAARADGACFVVQLQAHGAAKEWNAERASMRAAVALEIARQEIDRALDAAHAVAETDAARVALGTGGDPREAADRAAWWAWPSIAASTSGASSASGGLRSTLTLAVPLPLAVKGATPSAVDADAMVSATTPKFTAAVARAKLAWARPEIDVRGRVEVGQGELWALVGSSCGVAHETSTDAGLASVAIATLVSASAPRATTEGVTIEPWIAPGGVGVVAHAANKPGESASAHAQRVSDLAARSFLASFPRAEDVVVARAESLIAHADAPAATNLVRAALAATRPDRPSFLYAEGDASAVAHVGVDAVALRLTTLRDGPLRLAVIADVESNQIDVATRAADRWAPRRPGETRSCPAIDPGAAPKGGLHAITVKSGTGVAFAFPVDESQRDVATLIAFALSADGGRLAPALGGVASSFDARLVRGLDRSALVVVALLPDANVDAVSAKIRALLESLRTGALTADDLSRAEHARADAILVRRLDPRARLVDLFLGDAPASSVDLAHLRSAAAALLDEDRAQVVLARLK